MSAERFLESLAKGVSARSAAAVSAYLTEGGALDLRAVPVTEHADWALALRRVMARPDAMDEHDVRALELLYRGRQHDSIGTWLSKWLNTEKPGEDLFSIVDGRLRAWGASPAQVALIVLRTVSPLVLAPESHSAARGLLTLPAEVLLGLLVQGSGVGARLARLLFAAGPDTEARARRIFTEVLDPGAGAAGDDPEKARREMLDAAIQALKNNSYESATMARSILKAMGERSVAIFKGYIAIPATQKWQTETRQRVMDMCVSHLGEASAPILWAAVEGAEAPLKIAALTHLSGFDRAVADPERIEKAVLDGLENAKEAAKFVPAAGRLRTPACVEKIWGLATGKGKTVRAAAAEAVATADPGALDRAAGLQAEKSKDARWGGVLALGKLAASGAGAPEKADAAVECLLNRVRNEPDADVRDAAMRALRGAGVAFERIADAAGPADLGQMRGRAAALKGPAVKWLAEEELPPLRLADCTVLDAPLVKYLLHRQSRQPDPIPDPEVMGLYRLIDRQTSGDFAHKLFSAFLEAGPAKADAWALVAAALLGDNRVVTGLASKVRSWAESFDQKLGTWGVEALALNGSVPALAALHAIATKFAGNPRRKLGVIGDAAQEAVEKAAARLKLSMDELGDALVPSLGFEPGRPRVVEAGERRIEATIGLDFKLAMKDLATGKKVASIPKAAPADVQAEFKGLGKLLQEVAKAQAARLERLMVNQHRWPAARWAELFQQQPVLFPFSVRLVWGAYDAAGTLAATFRALPDRTLTDAADEAFELAPAHGTVGIVHPLELPAERREAWRSHLADYEIEQPFAQVERPVVRVPDDLRELKAFEGLKDASLNAYAFRGKVEKAGWTRGAVGDGGMVGAYRKKFDKAGVEAFAVISGMPVYADPSATTTVEQVVFTPVGTGEREFLERRMKLGDVPAMVYSESVGELMRVFGKV